MCDDLTNHLPQEKICNHYCTCHLPPPNIVLHKSAIVCVVLMNRLPTRRRFVIIIAPVISPPRNIVLHNSAIMFVVLMNRLPTKRRFLIIIAIMCDDDMIKILRNFHASVIQILVYVCTLA